MVDMCWESGSYQEFKDRIYERFSMGVATVNVRMIGLMFARPNSPFAKSEVIPQISDWHYRSGDYVDIYFAGYRNHFDSADSIEVKIPGRESWFYSAKQFNEFRQQIESISAWEYGGGCELLLTNARRHSSDGHISIDFSSAICCGLDVMKAEQAIHSVEHFLEDVFRFAEGAGGHDDPTWGFSDKKGIAVAGSALKQAVLSLLPKGIGVEYRKAAHMAIHDISL